jgi:hypothetical protein
MTTQFKITICGDIDGDVRDLLPVLYHVAANAHVQVQDPELESPDESTDKDATFAVLSGDVEITNTWFRVETRG